MMASTEAGSRARLRDDVLAAILAARERTLHFYGYFMGFRWTAVADGQVVVELPPRAQSTERERTIALTPLAVLADVALGSAVRSRLRSRHTLTTVDLRLDVIDRTSAEVTVRAEVTSSDGRSAHARGLLTSSDGRILAQATATFLIGPVPATVDHWRQPWEQGDPPGGQPTPSLDTDETELLRSMERLIAECDPSQCYPTIFPTRRHRLPSGDGVSEQDVMRGLLNRMGTLQGGVVFGLAAEAVEVALGGPVGTGQNLSLTVTYLRATDSGCIRATGHPVHAGRRLFAAEVRVIDDADRVLAVGTAQVLSTQPAATGRRNDAEQDVAR